MDSASVLLLVAALLSCASLSLGITGGSDVDITACPYLAAIDLGGQFLCGGAIVDKRWILTASSCFNEDTVDVNKTTVRVGASFREATGETFMVTKTSRHDNVLLLKVDDDIDLSIVAQVAPLVGKGKPAKQGQVVIVTGFGDTQEGEVLAPNALRKFNTATVPVLDQLLCRRVLPETKVSGPTVCAGTWDKSLCGQADLGDPLVNWMGQLVGVAYSVPSCNGPAAFVDISDSSIHTFIANAIAS